MDHAKAVSSGEQILLSSAPYKATFWGRQFPVFNPFHGFEKFPLSCLGAVDRTDRYNFILVVVNAP